MHLRIQGLSRQEVRSDKQDHRQLQQHQLPVAPTEQRSLDKHGVELLAIQRELGREEEHSITVVGDASETRALESIDVNALVAGDTRV